MSIVYDIVVGESILIDFSLMRILFLMKIGIAGSSVFKDRGEMFEINKS